jgi:hypothetical protein
VQEAEQHWQPLRPLGAAPAAGNPRGAPQLGQVAGVAKGHAGTVWVLHRGGRVWDAQSFEGESLERTTYKEPIAEDVVLQLDQETGAQSCRKGSPSWRATAGQAVCVEALQAVDSGNLSPLRPSVARPCGSLSHSIGQRMSDVVGPMASQENVRALQAPEVSHFHCLFPEPSASRSGMRSIR